MRTGTPTGMRKTSKTIFFFPSVTKARVLLLLGITLLASFLEGFGVAMLFPVMDFIEKGKDFAALSETSRMWALLNQVFDFLSIPKNLIALMIIVFALLMVRQIFIYWRTVYTSWITESIFSDIRSAGFKWFVKAEMSFYDAHSVGQIINVLTVDGARAGAGVFTFFNLIASGMIFAIYLVFLLFLSPGMTLLALVIMGGVGMTFKSLITRTGRIGKKISEYNERISAAILERLNGIRLLKLSSTEEKEKEFVDGLSRNILLSTYDTSKIKARMEFTIEPMVLLAGLMILYFSVEVSHMSLAKTGMFLFVLLRVLPYTKDVLKSRQSLAGFAGSLDRVIDLLEEAQRAETIRGGSVSVLKLEKGIRFEGVGFSYNRAQGPVLTDLNLFFPAGRMTALVGRSGAGKSTLVDLIPRLRVPDQGKILIDDMPIEAFDLRVLRRSIAFVSQEGFLFDDTIENNIRYSRQEASQDEIREASQAAYADGFVSEFPEGYRTMVGERGTKLSGGQRQRIILARALLQKARVIILDEPTSALDSESEQFIQKAMEKIRVEKDITMIVIAHRLSTIRSADQIIVLDKGRVVETGSHGELIHEEAWYADMVKMQAMTLDGVS
jgi:ATP-binding cassette, subfamily B, bacterial MsbA